MILAYNTNGFAHHLLDDALAIIAGAEYGGVSITPDVHHLNPFEPDLPGRLLHLREELERRKLKCVIETGARFLLDAHRKHQPTLVSPTKEERDYRFEFLALDAIPMAAELSAEVVSFWSGTPTDEAGHDEWMDRLVDGCKRLADVAAGKNVGLAFEPEPGMFLDTMDKFTELHDRVNHPAFGLTLDIGHLKCLGEMPTRPHLQKWRHKLWNIHIEDMKTGVHDHLKFGDGEIDFAEVFASLKEIDYAGFLSVELSRHSHDAVRTAKECLAFLASHVGVPPSGGS
jgi:L-ribulose-5-phosphate 3-epimerase